MNNDERNIELAFMQKNNEIKEKNRDVLHLLYKVEYLKAGTINRNFDKTAKDNIFKYHYIIEELRKHGLKECVIDFLENEATAHLCHIAGYLSLYTADDITKLNDAASVFEKESTYDLVGLKNFVKAIREIRMDVCMR